MAHFGWRQQQQNQEFCIREWRWEMKSLSEQWKQIALIKGQDIELTFDNRILFFLTAEKSLDAWISVITLQVEWKINGMFWVRLVDIRVEILALLVQLFFLSPVSKKKLGFSSFKMTFFYKTNVRINLNKFEW